VALLFDTVGGPENSGARYESRQDFCQAVVSAVPSATQATLYYSAGAPSAAGAVVVTIAHDDLGPNVPYSPSINEVWLILVPAAGKAATAGQVTMKIGTVKQTGTLQVIEGGIGQVAFTLSSGVTLNLSSSQSTQSVAFTLAGSHSAIANAIVLVQYNFKTPQISSGA
jgi:hypothetical protein